MITVLGAGGFVGSAVSERLRESKTPFCAPGRDEDLRGKELGDVIYCIGLTADFRKYPFQTVEAHICRLKYVLEHCKFSSLTYLSSTRMYIHNEDTFEDKPVVIDPSQPADLYNVSKLAGEMLALNCGRANIKIARLSNVYGFDFLSDNFITSILKDALTQKKIVLRTTPSSSKDYIYVDDVAALLIKLSSVNGSGIYNIAAGSNTSNYEILSTLHSITGCEIVYEDDAAEIIFPAIRIDKIRNEFNFVPSKSLAEYLAPMVQHFKNELDKNETKSS